MMGVMMRLFINIVLIWILALYVQKPDAYAQLFDSEIEGLTADQWADKIVSEGDTLFSAQYEPLGEDYKLYSLMIQIVLGNPTPEAQLSLAKTYKEQSEKSGERRHMLISQMFDELLSGNQNVDYYIENGDWFTIMIARWIDANFLDRQNAKFADLYYFYEVIVESKSDDTAYPAAMILLTDMKRTRLGLSGDLSAYIRNYKENYYWMKRLYPDYDVTFVYAFDTLSIHYTLFGDPSALKIIDSIDQRSVSPINSLIMVNRKSRIHLHNGEYKKASDLLQSFFQSSDYAAIQKLSVCANYCPLTHALAALSAIASRQPELAQNNLEAIKSANITNEPDFIFYHKAANALLDMKNPTDVDIENWVQVTKNGQSRREFLTYRQLVDPSKRFTPPVEPAQSWPGLPWILTLLALTALSVWLLVSLRRHKSQLNELSLKHRHASDRGNILDQYLGQIHALNERSGANAQAAILSLERQIDNLRTLEAVDHVSRNISTWSEELSGLIVSAKHLATGRFEHKDLIDLPAFLSAARARWERTARLEKSTLVSPVNVAPQKLRTNKTLLSSVLDLFVNGALQEEINGVVEVNFEILSDQNALLVVLKSQGSICEDFSNLLDSGNPMDSETLKSDSTIDNQNQAYALKALIKSGGRFKQNVTTDSDLNVLKLFFPIEFISDDPNAANSNHLREDNSKDELS